MDLALAVRDVLLVPRCAECGEPGSWFCFACRDQCEPVAHDGRLALRAAGPHAGPLRAAVRRLKYGVEPGLAEELGALVALGYVHDHDCCGALGAICLEPRSLLLTAARR